MDPKIEKKSTRVQEILSQVVACSSLYFLLIDIGMSVSFITLVIPDVLNSATGITLSDTEASWLGSMAYLCQPMGSLLSGPLMDYFGRKKSFFLVNIPHLVAWSLMAWSPDKTTIFIANALLGLGTGIMEAPSITYVGEISDPMVRGMLSRLASMFTSLGILITYTVGSFLTWRQTAAISIIIPLLTMAFGIIIPESPVWFLSRGKKEDALKALCYIRGWTTPEHVEKEFTILVQTTENFKTCIICSNSLDKTVCPHKDKFFLVRLWLKYKYLIYNKETLRPLALVISYFAFYSLNGLEPIRPNLINICKAFGMRMETGHLIMTVGALQVFTDITSAILIKLLGKRKLIVGAQLCVALSTLGLAVYAQQVLPITTSSYNEDTFPKETSIIPVIIFFIMTGTSSLGIPWVLVSEVFPFKSRGSAAGIAAACSYIITFVSSKTYLEAENGFHMFGAFYMYAIIAFIGAIFLYSFIPETENKTLTEIEDIFAQESQVVKNPFKMCLGVNRRNLNITNTTGKLG